MFAGSPSIMSFLVAQGDTRLRERSTPPVVSIGYAVGGTGQDLYFTNAGILGNMLVPVTPDYRVKLGVHAAAATGLITLSETDLEIDPDQEIVEIALPLQPRATFSTPAPKINSGELKFGPESGIEGPYLELKGKFLLTPEEVTPKGSVVGTRLEDLYVTFEIGGRDTVGVDGKPVAIGGKDAIVTADQLQLTEDGLLVPVPRGIMVSAAEITLTRKQEGALDGVYRVIEVPSNSVKLLVQPKHSFVLNGADGTVTVIDNLATQSSGAGEIRDPREVARIPLGLDTPLEGLLKPRKSKLTQDGSRLYVTYSSSSFISVIDAVGFQEIDTVPDDLTGTPPDPNTIGTQGIMLPVGAKPFDLTVDNDGLFLFVTDELKPNLYVIDIDPFSPNFHKVVQTLTFDGSGEEIAPLGLRGVVASTDRKSVFVAAPGRDLFRPDSGQPGRILVAQLLSTEERRRIQNEREGDEPILVEPLVFDPSETDAIIEYGVAPYDLTVTDDPNVVLVTDRVADGTGVGVIRRYFSDDGKAFYETNAISLIPFGLDPVQGREVQAFGTSNAQGITFIPANKYEAILGPHPSYAIFSTFNAMNSELDSKKNPNLAPFFASYPEAGPDPRVQLRIDGQKRQFPVGAGSTIGFIRNPLGDFESPLLMPRLVAATNPILNGFADDVTVTENGLAMVPMQAQDTVFAYNAVEAIGVIELAAKAPPTTIYESRSQYTNVPPSLTSLVRGPLGQIPIDLIYPSMVVAAHFGFYDSNGNTGYGVPPTDPFGGEPNLYGPIAVGNLPRGIETQVVNPAPQLQFVPTPYTQTPSLQSFPNGPQTIESGSTTVAEIHSGALHETHGLVTYQSQGAQRGVQLHYDSLRAEPRFLTYLGLAGLDRVAKSDSMLVARATATFQGRSFASESIYEPTPAEFAAGFRGDEHFFDMPTSLKPDEVYGSSLWLDLRDADTGVYDLAFDYGVFRERASGFVDGNFQTDREYLAVVNGMDSEFGAGWGIEGLQRIYAGDGALLLVDGNGSEQIFLAPSIPGEAFTPLSLERSVLRQKEDGTFERRMIDGTLQLFDHNGLQTKIIDRNENETKYEYDDDGHIKAIIDPVGLRTKFEYSGELVSAIIDPAGRTTRFKYSGKNLVEIVDPDGSKRTFEYDAHVPKDPAIEPYEHLLTGQVLKRGNDPDEKLGDPFRETIEYNDFGRVIGGERVDKKSFTLKPAQMTIAGTPEFTGDPDRAPELVGLLGKPPETLAQLEAARLACGLPARSTAGSVFTAEAIYTDFDGREDRYQMDGFGSYTELAHDKPGRAFGRDADDGLIGVQVNQVNNVTCTTYDDFGNVLTISDFPDGSRKATTTFEYQDQNFPSIWTKRTDSLGRTSTRSLDASGNILLEQVSTSQQIPAGNPTSTFTKFTYFTSGPADGMVQTIEDANGQVTEYVYDGFGRLIETKHVDGSEFQSYGDLTGNVVSHVDADGFRIDMTYDPMNRFLGSVVMVNIDNATYSNSAEYDDAGNVIREVDRNGVVTTFDYDLLDRVSKRIEALGQLDATTEYAYEFGEMSALASVPFERDYTYRYEKNPNGHVSLFVEDDHGNPRYSVDAIGRVTKFLYNEAYQLIGTTLPDGGQITMKLDGRGRIIEQSGPTTEKILFSYDDDNHVLTQTIINSNTGNQVTTNQYNLFGTLARTIDAEGHVTRIEHDATNTPRKIIINDTGSDQRTMVMELDGRNRPIRITENGLAVTTKEYFPSGRIKAETNANGARTLHTYDELGRIVSNQDAEGNITHFVYDGNGNEVAMVDGRAQGDRSNTEFRVTKDYDALGRLIRVRNQVGDVTQFEFDKVGNQTKIIDPRSVNDSPIHSMMEYDAVNRLKKLTNPEGRTTTYFRDVNNNIERIESQRVTATGSIVTDVTRHQFDKSSRLQWTIDAVGARTEFTYDEVGNLIRITDSRGPSSRTEIKHDKLNRAVERTLAAGSGDAATTKTIFHPLGMVQEVIDPLGQRTVTTFDALYRPATITVAAGSDKPATTEYRYDLVGNLLAITDPRGSFYTTTYAYDDLNRVVLTAGPSGTPDSPKRYEVETEYDEVGNVIRMTDPRGTYETRKEYDAAGRVSKFYDQKGQVTTYAYDAAGNVTKQTSPAVSDAGPAVMQFTYDSFGHRESVKDSLGNTSWSLHDDNGRVITTIDPRANLESASVGYSGRYATQVFYDGRGRRVAAVDAGGYRSEWEYDVLDNVVRLVDPRTFDGASPGEFITTMTYDALGHLKERHVPIGENGTDAIAIEKYVYDKVGNLIEYQDPRGAAYKTSYTYDALYHPKTTTIQAVGAAGQTTLVSTTIYDVVGNLVESIDPRGEFYRVQYRYDAGNRMVEMLEPTGTPDQPGPVAVTRHEFDQAGNLVAEHDPRGDYYTSTLEIDELGRVKRQSVPTGSPEFPQSPAITTYEYSPGGSVTKINTPRRNAGENVLPEVQRYDAAGRLIEKVDTFGAKTTYTYDEAGNTIEVVEVGTGTTPTRTTKVTYDDLGRVSTVEDAGGFVTKNTYDAVGNVIRVEGPYASEDGVSVIERHFDGRGLVRSEKNAEGNVTTYEYDLAGNRIRVGDPRGDWADIQYTYDGANRLIEISQPTGTSGNAGTRAITRFVHDGVGNVIKKIDPRGEAFATLTTYDFRRKPVEVQLPSGSEVNPIYESDRFAYDLRGNLIRKEDPRGPEYATTYDVDAAGRVLRATHAVRNPINDIETLTELFTYDVEGNRIRHQEMGGVDYVTTSEHDALGRVTLRTDAIGETTRSTYDRYGNMLTQTDVYGTTTFTYDVLGRLTTTTNPAGETIRTIYDANGLDSTTYDPLNRATITKRDRLGRTIETVDANGQKMTMRYDEVGNVIELVDRNGNISNAEFDARNLAVRQSRAVGTSEEVSSRIEYDLLNRKIAEIDPRGDYYRTEYTFDARHRVVETRRHAGTTDSQGIGSPGETDWIVERYQFDSVGNSIGMTPARGDFYNVTTLVDGLGRVYEMRRQVGTPDQPQEEVQVFEYDAAGHLISSTNSLGHEVKREYDKVGRITSETVIRPGEADLTSTFRYLDTQTGYRIEKYDVNGNLQVATDYDQAKRAVRIEPRSGEVQTMVYDGAGNQIELTKGDVRKTFEYDFLNRLVEETDGHGNAIRYSYDPNGNLLTKQDARRSTPISYTYDALNRKRIIQDPDEGRTFLNYDKVGNLIALKDATESTTVFQFDAMNRMISEENAFGTRTYSYDPAGNVVRYVDRNERVTERTYDGNQRLVREDWFSGSSTLAHSLQFQYDVLGRMTRAIDGESVIEFNFASNSTGQLTSTTTTLAQGVPSFTTQYDRNTLGQAIRLDVSQATNPNLLTEEFGYHSETDRLTSISQSGSAANSKRVEFSYHEDVDLFSEIRRYNAANQLVATTTVGINDRQLPSQIRHVAGQNTINQYDYRYDADSRVIEAEDLYGKASYSYDATGRLTATQYTDPNMVNETYQLDSNGNRTNSSIHGAGYAYQAHNRLQSDGVFDYKYDDEGNLIEMRSIATGDTTQFEWDHRNRMVQAVTKDSQGGVTELVDFGYDALNRRIWKLVDTDGAGPVGNHWRGYLYNNQDVLLEIVDVDGLEQGDAPRVEVVYLHGASGSAPLAQDVNLATHWLLADRLGTVRDIVSGAGQLLDHIRYDSYGRILSRTDASVFNRHFFAGRPWESELGWYYNQARFYDPAIGRFVSEDPSSFTAGEPNLYRYGVNDPVNNIDPSGLSAISALSNPLHSAFNEFRKQSSDMALRLEQSQTFMGINVVTFSKGVYEDASKIAFPVGVALASTLATAYFPPAAPVIALGAFTKSMIDLKKAADQPGNEGLELWDGVKAFGGAVAGLVGFRAAFIVGTLLNTADMGVGIYYNDRDRQLGALTGFFTDSYGYRISARAEVSKLAKDGKSVPVSKSISDDIGLLKSDVGNMQWESLIGRPPSRTASAIWEQKTKGIKSDFAAARQYVDQARQFRSKNATGGAVADLISLRMNVEPPQFTTSIFRKLHSVHRALESGRAAWHGSIEQRIHDLAIQDVRGRTSGEIKIDDSKMSNVQYARNTRLRLATESDLVSMITDTNWLPGPSTPTSSSRHQRLQRASQAALQELQGSGPTRASLEASIRDAGNRIIEYNMINHTQYREQLIRMANDQLRQSRAQLDPTAISSLHEQTIALHASALLRVDNPEAPTPSAPFNHEIVQKKLPDMIRRLEMETISRQYPTLEGAQEMFRSLSNMSQRKSLVTGRNTVTNDRHMNLLQSHIETMTTGKQAMRRINREMHEMFPKGADSIKSDLDHFRYSQAQALKSIIRDKAHSFEGPWQHLVERLTVKNDAFSDILDLPFASHQQLKELADLTRAVNSGDLVLPGIDQGSIVSIMLQGTAGSTISQIAHRANFVKDVYSGNIDRLYSTLRNPGEAWRTLADLTKSPMREGSSDVDLGLVVQGGGEKFLSVFQKAEVTFPNASVQQLKGGAAIQAIVNWSDPNSFIGQTARTPGLDVPVEWYVYQNRELAQIGDVSTLMRTPIDRGGISIVPDGSTFNVVAHFSPFLDTYAKDGGPSRILAGGFLHSSYASIATSQSFVNATDFAQVTQESLRRWKIAGLDTSTLTVNLHVQDLPGSQLGYALIHNVDEKGRPDVVTIVVDRDAAGHGWFIDATPEYDDEFALAPSGVAMATSKLHQGKFDALTVLQHEIGHLLGFTSSLDGFQSLLQKDDFGRPFVEVAEGRAWLDPTGNELDKLRHTNSLMSATLTPGIRKSASKLEAAVIEEALTHSIVGFQHYLVQGHLHGDGLGFTPIQTALDQRGVSPNGLRNSNFQQTNSTSADFGWSIVGQVDVIEGSVTIVESSGLVSDLSQSFVIPSGVQKLQFTLSGLQMEVGSGTNALDAFEVALLGVDDGDSLVGAIPGLTGTDALLNIQADGRVRLAAAVSIEGVQNGDLLDFTKPYDVSIDLSNLPASEAATLLFDLVGFGEDDSQVSISDIKLQGALPVSWHNSAKPLDVNNDGLITPLDALQIINELNARRLTNNSEFSLPTITDDVAPPPFYDVSNDGRATPFDALLVINHLNRASGGTGGNNGNNGGTGGEGDLPSSWHNTSRPMDVTNNQEITALDALQIINELNQPRISDPVTKALPTITQSMKPAPYLDVSNDQLLTALDALLVINYLNSRSEGEAGQVSFDHPENPLDDDDSILDLLASDQSSRKGLQ